MKIDSLAGTLIATACAGLLLAGCNPRAEPKTPPAPQAAEQPSKIEQLTEEAGASPDLVAERSDAYRQCMASDAAVAETSSALESCADDELALQDKAVEEALAALLAKQPAHDQALTRKAQAAWVSYRTAECSSRAAINEGGTIQGLVIATCRTDLALLRLDDLKDQAETY